MPLSDTLYHVFTNTQEIISAGENGYPTFGYAYDGNGLILRVTLCLQKTTEIGKLNAYLGKIFT